MKKTYYNVKNKTSVNPEVHEFVNPEVRKFEGELRPLMTELRIQESTECSCIAAEIRIYGTKEPRSKIRNVE